MEILKDLKKGNKNFLYLSIIFFLSIYSLFTSYFLIIPNIILEKNKEEILNKIKKIEIERNFLNSDLILKDYSSVEFKITEEGQQIINNIRNLHKSPILISGENIEREVCAGYIWTLTEKIWGNTSPYYIGMLNTKTKTPSKAWELAHFYSNYGGKVLIDFSNKFSLEKKDYWSNITLGDLKSFFSNAFSEDSLLGDIGFLYSNTKYNSFLQNRSYNSHITKNMGLSDFEIVLQKDYKNKSHVDIISDIFGCGINIKKDLLNILENYKIFLNNKKIVLYNSEFYYLGINNELGEKVEFKFNDKLRYKDITIAHFFEKKSNIDSLFNFVCKGEFYPINIISINPRFIEKK